MRKCVKTFCWYFEKFSMAEQIKNNPAKIEAQKYAKSPFGIVRAQKFPDRIEYRVYR